MSSRDVWIVLSAGAFIGFIIGIVFMDLIAKGVIVF